MHMLYQGYDLSKTSRFEIDFDRWNVIAGASAANEVCDPGNSAS